MIILSPNQLQRVINAAFFEIARHPEDNKMTKPTVNEIYLWLIKHDWDNPNDPVIMIEELPF